MTELTADDLNFGDDDAEFTLSPEQCAEYLERIRQCPIGEPTDEMPWISPDPLDGHGHTDCLYVGWAIHHLRSL